MLLSIIFGSWFLIILDSRDIMNAKTNHVMGPTHQ